MPAHAPEEINRLFTQAFNAGDLEGLVALYEPGASLVPQPGQPVTGAEALREALRGFLALKPTLEMAVRKRVQSGDLALLCADWRLTGTGPDGQPIQMAGTSVEVARRQPDGTWLYVIDDPYGVG